ncbi:hypothetical protein AQUCO_07400091v1 [Aquilegia coerulea]|uniref:Uncharacterized protein n=1 Tax=Aquilegia coerulea TaxID=218851 RepID=A0A2G5C9R1_AQUCA|nr:hypothetical protein AQUCO_07400091v1 [Aquilegia coerulea]
MVFKGYPKATLINIPRFGGKFAAFISTWVALECTMDYYHGKDDNIYHHFIGLPATILLFKSRRQGFRVTSISAIGWGSLYAIITIVEGLYQSSKVSQNYGRSYYFVPPLPSDYVPPHKSDDDYVPPPSSDDFHIGDFMICNISHQERLKNFGGRMFFGGLVDWFTSSKTALEEDDEDEEAS